MFVSTVVVNLDVWYVLMMFVHYISHIFPANLLRLTLFSFQGSLNEGCRSENGSVVGVIHQMFVLDGGKDDNISDMMVSTGDDLSERKRLLLDNADAVIVLPVDFEYPY